jgi:hypothetical protein
MKIRIIDANDDWWYENKIGRIFTVEPNREAAGGRPIYHIIEGPYKGNYMLADHCVEYKEYIVTLPEDMFEL